MTTLIDRYVSAAVERVPDQQRTEVANEIRGAITEMVEQRVEAGGSEDRATEQVLTELGDPVELGESYVDRPRYVIGPGWYPTYLSAIKAILLVVLPIVAIVSLAQSIGIEHEQFANVIADAIGSVVQAAIQILFWITAAFAVAERFAGPRMPVKRDVPWTTAELPKSAPSGQVTLGDTLPAVIALIVFGVLAAVQHRDGVGFFVRGGSDSTGRLPLINPDLAIGWQVGFFALLAVSLLVEIVRYLRGVWTRSMFLLAVAESAAWIIYIVVLAVSAPIINPELGRRIEQGNGWWKSGGAANTIIAIVIIWAMLQSVWEGWNGYRRFRQGRSSGPILSGGQ